MMTSSIKNVFSAFLLHLCPPSNRFSDALSTCQRSYKLEAFHSTEAAFALPTQLSRVRIWTLIQSTSAIINCILSAHAGNEIEKKPQKRLSRSMPSQMSFLQCNVTSLLFIRIKSSVFQNQITLISYFLTWFSEEEEKRRAKEEPESGGISWGMTDDDVEVSFPGTGCFSF